VKTSLLTSQVLDLLTLTGPVSSAVLAEGLGCSRYQIGAAVGRLKRQGVVHRPPELQRQGCGFPSNAHRYRAVWAIGPEPEPPARQALHGRTGITPADAPHWLEQGYLLLVHQGKLTGYVIALPGYRLVMGRENHEPR